MGDSGSEFRALFEKATGHGPFPWQERMALEGDAMPSLVSVPTGLGKTAGVILAWLWRRRFDGESTRQSTPRRLVYCLPMRVLVEQTRDCSREWLGRLGILAENAPAEHPADKVAVHVLMGGDLETDWDRWPERDQILIGTQDMMLSRALNRGYAMSRFRWPVQFALLNNDCHWVLDEVQLMGSGLATSTQLQAFRRIHGTASSVGSTWMSATMRPEWLGTVDFVTDRDAGISLELDAADRAYPRVVQRLDASKPIIAAGFAASKDGRAEAGLALDRHQAGTLTLVVVNTVKRATGIHAALAKQKPAADLVLVHSRFRPGDRQTKVARLLASPGEHGTIAVSTQVVEAGVDVSARTLITDIAPWSSMVQRFGRCNRYGEDQGAVVAWIDVDRTKAGAAPYEVAAIDDAADKLADLADAGPSRLPEIDTGASVGRILRRPDLIGLFDTTPDLAGADIDVSRFIRENDEHHVQVFWREFGDTPGPDEPTPRREELCSVAIDDLRKVSELAKWRWDHLEKGWARIHWDSEIYPGLVVLLRARDGCYSAEVGWTGAKKDKPAVLDVEPVVAEHNDDDRFAETDWQSLAEHTDAVVAEVDRLLADTRDLGPTWQSALKTAARWHDAGKAHPVFQRAVLGDPPARDAAVTWAKSGGRGIAYERPGFRHELVSGLAMLAHGQPDLAAYLAAAHHGKVRLSIRSLPHEFGDPGNPRRRFARGVWHGEMLPRADLGGGVTLPETELDLSLMELGEGTGGPSWLARMLALRDDAAIGPFRLAYLETMLRVADWRASARKEAGHA